MAKSNKFRPGQSGNAQTTFKAGNRFRWQPGQSGNPAGISRKRLDFEQAFYEALLRNGAPDEAAALLWQCAREREPWAIQTLLQRLAPSTQQIKLTHEVEHGESFDFSRLNNEEIDQLERLLQRTTSAAAAIEGGEGQTQLQGIRDAGLADSGAER